jgi:hypothetical protein
LCYFKLDPLRTIAQGLRKVENRVRFPII